MTAIYVASTEPFVGKSALCAALIHQLRERGYGAGYLKPVSVTAAQTEQGALDEDARLMRELFALPEEPSTLAPVLATPRVVEGVLRGEQPDFAAQVQAAYATVSANHEVVVLEGVNSWAEGALLGLSAQQVSALLDTPVLLINRYRTSLAADTIIAVQRFLGERLIGVVLNQVQPSQVEYVQSAVVPFLERQGIPVYGLLPSDPALEAVSVADLAEHLSARYVGGGADQSRLVENLSIGAMGAENALQFFRRKPNKAVITGGDRADLQIAALETSTACLVLTGNIRPSATVVARAEERGVPILMTSDDTLTVVQRAEALLGHIRFGHGDQHARFSQLAGDNLDLPRLLARLGLNKG